MKKVFFIVASLYLSAHSCFSMMQEPQGITYEKQPAEKRGIYIQQAANKAEILFEEKDLDLIDNVTSHPNQLAWTINLKPEATHNISVPETWDKASVLKYCEACKGVISTTFSTISALRYTGVFSWNMLDRDKGFMVPVYPDQVGKKDWILPIQETYEAKQLQFFGEMQGDRNLDGKLKKVPDVRIMTFGVSKNMPRHPVMTVNVKEGKAILSLEERLINPTDEITREYIRKRVNLTLIHTLGVNLIESNKAE